MVFLCKLEVPVAAAVSSHPHKLTVPRMEVKSILGLAVTFASCEASIAAAW
jgi:hypothetical protein